MTDYSTYTLEGACAVLIVAVAHKIYKMRCDSSSRCCGESINFSSHNSGEGHYELSQRELDRSQRPSSQPEEQV